MPTNPISERELVKRCMAELCREAGFADPENMVQRDLQFLGERIESRTGISISLSTIKRLLNGQFSRLPQVATLDAIARFRGYQNWQSFKVSRNAVGGEGGGKMGAGGELGDQGGGEGIGKAGDGEGVSVSGAGAEVGIGKTTVGTGEGIGKEAAVAGTGTARGNKFARASWMFWGGGLVLAALGLVAIVKMGRHGWGNTEQVPFSAVKVTGNDLPNTVIFKYNLDGVDADSFFIQQSWDRNRRVRIARNSSMFTDIYYEPGYHVAKLIANDQIIKTVDVSIPTDRWFFYAKDRLPASPPQYIFPVGLARDGSAGPVKEGSAGMSKDGLAGPVKDGRLKLTMDDLLASRIDFQKEHDYLMVYFPTRIGSSSDNFVLNYRIRVNPVNNDFCPYFMGEVFCQRHFMYFKSGPKGCTSELGAQFGENYLSGKTHDFSAMGTDVKTWQRVEERVKDKKVSICLNGIEVFSAVYHQSCGSITGLGFISNGLCEVDSIDLKTPDGKDFYGKDFGQARR